MNDWNYRCAHYIHVVISRVRTREGLFLVRPLDLEKDFSVPGTLVKFERRMRNETETTL